MEQGWGRLFLASESGTRLPPVEESELCWKTGKKKLASLRTKLIFRSPQKDAKETFERQKLLVEVSRQLRLIRTHLHVVIA